MFDFSAYKPSLKAQAAAEHLDTDSDLFKGNRWISRPKDSQKIFRYREFLKRTRDKDGPAAARLYARRLANDDLFYLCHQVLGFKDLYEPLHGDLCDFIQATDNGEFSTLVEMPRSHYKSSIATTGRSIRWMIRDPKVTIGLFSATLKDCRPFGNDIRGLLEKCEYLHKLYPEIFYTEPRKMSDKWTQEEFSIKRLGHIREATVTLFGLEDDIPVGKHFKKLIGDDIINKDNVRTPERMAKIKSNVELLQPLKVVLTDPVHFVGTPYHLHDSYAKMESQASIKVFIRKVYEGGKPAFPTKFSKASLEQLRIDYGNYLFKTQYMMERQSDEDKKFGLEWLKVDPDPITPKDEGYVFFLSVDPASARRKDSDFTSMLVHAMDWKMNFHLVDGLHDKLNPDQRIQAVFDFVRKWGINWVSYETIGFQKTDSFYIHKKMREENTYFSVFEVSHHKENKDDRIMGVQPIMSGGHYYVPAAGIPYKRIWASPDDGYGREVDIVEQLKLEMTFYPQAAHDDILDTTAQARSVVYAGSIPLPKMAPRRYRTAYGRPPPNHKEFNPMVG